MLLKMSVSAKTICFRVDSISNQHGIIQMIICMKRYHRDFDEFQIEENNYLSHIVHGTFGNADVPLTQVV